MMNRKTIGKTSTKLIKELSRNRITVFTIQEAATLLNTEKTKIRKLLHDLIERGWIQQIQRGRYLFVPFFVDAATPYTEHQFVIGSKLILPYYIGYWSMLNHYGYTEQLSTTVFIASPKRKRNCEIRGVRYKFVKLHEYKMFGLDQIRINNTQVQVSDKEKTLIDSLDHPEYCGGIVEAIKCLWNAQNDISFDKMLDYTDKMRNSSIAKRLGYLLEVLEIKNQSIFEKLKKKIKQGFSPLDPLLPKEGTHLSRWNLVINVPKEDLLSWKTS